MQPQKNVQYVQPTRDQHTPVENEQKPIIAKFSSVSSFWNHS